MAEMSDYWLYSMNAPFGRTRGGEPDSPYNGFCTVFESESCPGRPASTSRPRVSPAARPDWMLGGGHGKAARAPALSRDDASVAEPRRRLGPDAGWEPGRGWAAGCRRRWWAPARRGGVAAGRRPDHGRRRRADSRTKTRLQPFPAHDHVGVGRHLNLCLVSVGTFDRVACQARHAKPTAPKPCGCKTKTMATTHESCMACMWTRFSPLTRPARVVVVRSFVPV